MVGAGDFMEEKMKLITLEIDEIIPYLNNPRKNNSAVDAVAESIRQCEYIAPIIVDENHVILAGHTRWKALKQLGYTEVQAIEKEGLSEEQKRKYRLLDNKTGELSGWDFSELEKEIVGLDFEGFDFGFDLLKEDDLDELDHLLESCVLAEKKPKQVQCPHCGELFEI